MTQTKEDIIDYQDTFKIVVNEIQEFTANVTKAHKNVYKEF